MQYRTLSLMRLFRVVFITSTLIVGGGLVFGASGIHPAKAEAAVDDSFDYKLGLEIPNSSVKMEANPLVDNGYGEASQNVVISSEYGMGYRLSVAAVDSSSFDMKNGDSAIKSAGGVLANGTWGILASSSDVASGNVSSLNFTALNGGGAESPLLTETANVPVATSFSRTIHYGVKVGLDTLAGNYSIKLRYSLTPVAPTTPVVIGVSPDSHDIEREEYLTIRGFNLKDTWSVVVDFNNDGVATSNESCKIASTSDNEVKCELPIYEKYGEYSILIDVENFGQIKPSTKVSYCYQPTITSVSPSTAPIKSSVGVFKMNKEGTLNQVLTDDGDIYQWGVKPWTADANEFQKVPLPEIMTSFGEPVVDIASNGDGYYAVTKSGKLYNWGTDVGRTIASDSTQYKEPTKIDSSGSNSFKDGAVAVSAGDNFMLVLGSNGYVYSWGYNDKGQLGSEKNKVEKIWSPERLGDDRIKDGEKYVDMSAGEDFAVALTDYGRVLEWGGHGAGNGVYGDWRLGFNTNSDAGHPHDVTGGSGDGLGNYYSNYHGADDIVDVMAGDNFVVARSQSGRIFSWGNNVLGQLGNGGASSNSSNAEITSYFGGDKIAGFDISGKTAIAWTENGKLYGWGENPDGILGVLNEDIKTPLQLAPTISVDGAVIGSDGVYVQGGDTIYKLELASGASDITMQFTHPLVTIMLTGKNLSSKIEYPWISDSSSDEYHNKALGMINMVGDTVLVQFSLAGMSVNNGYKVNARTYGGGVTNYGIDVAWSSAVRNAISEKTPAIKKTKRRIAVGENSSASDNVDDDISNMEYTGENEDVNNTNDTSDKNDNEVELADGEELTKLVTDGEHWFALSNLGNLYRIELDEDVVKNAGDKTIKDISRIVEKITIKIDVADKEEYATIADICVDGEAANLKGEIDDNDGNSTTAYVCSLTDDRIEYKYHETARTIWLYPSSNTDTVSDDGRDSVLDQDIIGEQLDAEIDNPKRITDATDGRYQSSD